MSVPRLVLALALALAGCTQTDRLPRSYAFGPGFGPAEVRLTETALAGWCDRAGWCPVPDPTDRDAVWFLVDPARQGHAAASESTQDRVVRVYSGEWQALDENARTAVLAHELGHVCIRGHLAGDSLMSAKLFTSNLDPVPSDRAVAAFWAGCGL